MKSKVRIDLVVFFILLLTCLFITFNKFFPPNWDFFSYHYYNGWAIINNRLDIDFMPCMYRTYFNPFFDAVTYFILKCTEKHPVLLLLISSIKLSLLFFLGYKITDFVLTDFNKNKKIAILFCIAMAMLSPIIMICNTFDNTDIPSGILCLLSFYLYVKNIFDNNSKRRNIKIFTALFILGLTFGLKYTNISYALAMFLTSLILIKNIKIPLKSFLISVAGFLLGITTTGLSWAYVLYDKFKNPFFPYFNNVFKSPFADVESVLASDFSHLKINSFTEYITMPLRNSLSEHNIGLELLYYDLKIILGFIVIIGLFILLKNKSIKEHTEKIINIQILYFLIYFTAFSYYINLFIFGNYRYILILFILIPILIYVLLTQITNKKILNILLLIIFCLSVKNYTMPSVNNTLSKEVPKKLIQIENLNFEDNSTILCANFLSAYIAPHQNTKVKYIGFTLPKEYLPKAYHNRKKTLFTNKYYTNKFLENKVEEEIKNSEHLYIIFSEESLGANFDDFKLYEQALNKYSNGKYNKIKDCKLIQNSIYEIENPLEKYKVCKIK